MNHAVIPMPLTTQCLLLVMAQLNQAVKIIGWIRILGPQTRVRAATYSWLKCKRKHCDIASTASFPLV